MPFEGVLVSSNSLTAILLYFGGGLFLYSFPTKAKSLYFFLAPSKGVRVCCQSPSCCFHLALRPCSSILQCLVVLVVCT